MPLYEYKCQKCGAVIELLVSGSKKPACSKCGSTKLDKMLSVFSAGGAKETPCCSQVGGSCPLGGGCSGGHCHL